MGKYAPRTSPHKMSKHKKYVRTRLNAYKIIHILVRPTAGTRQGTKMTASYVRRKTADMIHAVRIIITMYMYTFFTQLSKLPTL